MAVTVSDVEDLASKGWTQLNDSKQQSILAIAKNQIEGPLSGRVSTLPTVIGDQDDALKWLAAHYFELAEGGEAQSESTQGGNVSYNTVTGEWTSGLSQTRYGRTFRDIHLRDEQQIGMVRTR